MQTTDNSWNTNISVFYLLCSTVIIANCSFSGAQESLQQTALEQELAGEMVSIPAGTFRMGDLVREWRGDKQSVHRVTMSAFKLGKYEITVAQWDACVADGGCNGYTPEHRVGCDYGDLIITRSGCYGTDDEGWDRGNRPVVNVSWDDIQSFINWLNSKTGGNYRLPTEAEWEYAARAGSKTEYSWGNYINKSNRANCDGCGSQWDDDGTAPVGSFPANAWGLHDVHGNVAEWVQDCWNDSYEGAPTDGSAWTGGDCDWRVLRGGSWENYAEDLRSTSRGRAGAFRVDDVGFRLAQDE